MPRTPDDSKTNDAKLPALLLAGLALLAFLPRLVNLGSFSMWFDEVAETLQATGSLARAWAELKSDVVHPPLEGLLTWSLLHLGLDETMRRWFPITFGVATVLLLAVWTARRFGRIAGLAAGLFAAGAPLHVHYSQELRPYSLALLCVALGMIAMDRVLARIDGPRLGLALLAILGCLYSLYFAALVLLTFVSWLILDTAVTGQPEETARARRVLAWSPVFLLGLGLAYLPWLSTVLALQQRRIEQAANQWTWGSLAERWQALTVGSGTSGSGWGSVIVLLLVLLGSACAVRTAAGRAVLAAAFCGTVGVDLLLLRIDHWSNVRYNLMGWLFLAVLVGMGTDFLMRLRGRIVTAAALFLLTFAQAQGIVRDHHLRHDWRRVAEVVDELWRPGEPVLALNQSTRIPLLYYLRQMRSPAAAAVISVDGSHRRLARLWPGDRCALLVLRSHGRTGRVVRLTQGARELARYPASSGARLRLLTPRFRERLFHLLGGERSLGPAAPQALTLRCERELPPALRASRADRPYEPLLRLLGLRIQQAMQGSVSRESS